MRADVVHIPTVSAHVAAERVSQRLALPTTTARDDPWRDQSLGEGAAGVALLHTMRARAGLDTWTTAHTWLSAATRAGIMATADAGLYRGAPAVAFAVHIAADSGRYQRAVGALDRCVSALAHRGVDRALARRARGDLTTFAEFDVILGLTGIGAHLLQHAPGDDALERVLLYLTALTRPVRRDGDTLPGWWAEHGPHGTRSPDFPGGHANLGMAHGIAGPLALLALALRTGITVDGQVEAIERIHAWLDRWRQDDAAGPWWPQWITYEEIRSRRVGQPGPGRPSWCYGTPGIARAEQLAAIATGNTARRQMAEHALAACLSDANQLGRITDPGLCHGWAGVYQTAWRASNDSTDDLIAARLPAIADRLVRCAHKGGSGEGLLEGDSGLALALHTIAGDDTTTPGWDACLLIT